MVKALFQSFLIWITILGTFLMMTRFKLAVCLSWFTLSALSKSANKSAEGSVTFSVCVCVLTVKPKHLAPRGRVPVSVSEPGHPSAFCFPHWVPSETDSRRATDVLWRNAGLNWTLFTLHLSFSPSLSPAADCCASNLCSRFGRFSFLPLGTVFLSRFSFSC